MHVYVHKYMLSLLCVIKIMNTVKKFVKSILIYKHFFSIFCRHCLWYSLCIVTVESVCKVTLNGIYTGLPSGWEVAFDDFGQHYFVE